MDRKTLYSKLKNKAWKLIFWNVYQQKMNGKLIPAGNLSSRSNFAKRSASPFWFFIFQVRFLFPGNCTSWLLILPKSLASWWQTLQNTRRNLSFEWIFNSYLRIGRVWRQFLQKYPCKICSSPIQKTFLRSVNSIASFPLASLIESVFTSCKKFSGKT